MIEQVVMWGLIAGAVVGFLFWFGCNRLSPSNMHIRKMYKEELKKNGKM